MTLETILWFIAPLAVLVAWVYYTKERFSSSDFAHKAIYVAGYVLLVIWFGLAVVWTLPTM
ncbi:hypothetical protein [Lactococcus protaetiae]|uniref:Uncharacterized protein n=1 Tax=Lactococcus protaetiae TaxID=2592653 RepID=A0A514ZAB8_9LACT|nr:hypothetical protein [Lactococcus protaetiae]MCL2113645.1 hypothetical protein [Streptococcaceae bacterium]QDK71534.1 hypothetical protein FLP15_10630 [Lactococcus protaetiae]